MPIYRVTDKQGKSVKRGDTVTSFRGENFTFISVSRGPEYNGTAKVIVGIPGEGHTREYYDRVFDLTVFAEA